MRILQKYCDLRKATVDICASLEVEDFVVQPVPEVSPPKWHLAHTTWFFEEMILVPHLPGYTRFNDSYAYLFNSYYKGAGKHWLQSERGQLSRPTVREVLDYRTYVDKHVQQLLGEHPVTNKVHFLMDTGLHHEQQHQELLFMDIKYILAVNPSFPAYINHSFPDIQKVSHSWVSFDSGQYDVGFDGDSFSYDNERPLHSVYLQSFDISRTLVSNQDYLEFIESGGYASPQYWLSQGWDWVQKENIQAPLYWRKTDQGWEEFTLYGLQKLKLQAPVVHISYFEANAYANWKGCRLPTEQESELFLSNDEIECEVGGELFHPNQPDSVYNQVWWWTQSHYSAYPGFKPFDGVLGEYNGKFMCNQFVLKGGCVVTPRDHIRSTYRNFYLPEQRWMFSGIRLAKDGA